MTLLLDVDGVLADYNTAMGKLLAAVSYGRCEAPVGPPTRWDWLTDYPQDVREAAQRHVEEDGVFWNGLRPYPGIETVATQVNELANRGAHIYFVTSRPGHLAKIQTEEWLVRHGFDHPSVIISFNKGAVAAGVGATVFIDDYPENHLGVLRARGTQCLCLLPHQPWNADFTHPHVRRVPGPLEALVHA